MQHINLLKSIESVDQQILLLESYIGKYKTIIGQKEKLIGTIEKKIGNKSKNIGQYEKEIGIFEKQIGTLEKKIGIFEQKIGIVEKEIGEIQQEIGEVEKEIGLDEKEIGRVEKDIGEWNHVKNKKLREYKETPYYYVKRWILKNHSHLLEDYNDTISDGQYESKKWMVESMSTLRLNDQLHIEIIGGNIATPDAAVELAKAGVNAVKVGMGPGSICTTRIIAGIGVPQITAILEIKEALKKNNVKIIADGGIRFSGDIAKAISAGADSVMLGSLFAGTEEAPGKVELFQGRSFKTYRGMGSIGAMTERNDANRYLQEDIQSDKLVPEGIEGRVPYKGLVINVINQLEGGLRQSMGYVGCKDIKSMQLDSQFIEITNAGMTESHVHDVMITKEAPNYQRS